MNIDLKSYTFKTLLPYSWWIQMAKIREKPTLAELDSITHDAEINDNIEVIKNRIKEFCVQKSEFNNTDYSSLNKQQIERERNLWSFFAELKAYQEIKQTFENTKFLNQNDINPDFKASRNSEYFYFEVKRKRASKSEHDTLWIKKEIYTSSGYDEDKLQDILKSYAKDTYKKFKALNLSDKSKRIMIIDYEPSEGANIIKKSVADIFGQDFIKEVEAKFNLEIWPRCYFHLNHFYSN